MEFNRTGIILYTINYQRCVNFYQSILGLTIMFETDALTCFQFGDSYLMVEIDDENVAESIYKERVKTCLRMNVPDVRAFADKIIAKNVAVDYREHSWGTVAR
jgi:lactoylglutathione lyase